MRCSQTYAPTPINQSYRNEGIFSGALASRGATRNHKGQYRGCPKYVYKYGAVRCQTEGGVMMDGYFVKQDSIDGFWLIENEEGFEVAGPFDSEEDAHDYIESFLDD